MDLRTEGRLIRSAPIFSFACPRRLGTIHTGSVFHGSVTAFEDDAMCPPLLLPHSMRFDRRANGFKAAHGLVLATLALLCADPAPSRGADKPDALKPIGDPVRNPDGPTS